MKKYAYLDTAYILHITKSLDVAESHSVNKKIEKTDYPAKGGYPVDEKGNAYVLYSETEEKHRYEIPAELAELYKKLK